VDLSQVSDRLASAAAKVLEADAAAVLLWGGAESGPGVAAAHGVAAEALPLTDSREARDVRLPVAELEQQALPPGFATGLAAPLRHDGQSLGALHVYRSRPAPFRPDEAGRLQALAELGAATIALAQEEAHLERVEASKAQFIRVATHELRSPLAVAQSLVRNVLKGYAGALTDPQRDLFARISGRLDFLESLVNDLLDLAASRAPELAEREEPVVVNSSVGRAVLLLLPRAEEKGVALIIEPCCEELAVRASEEGLDRIFVNLVGNAIKYTPTGGRVTVTMSRTEEEIQVRVADTGIGIPAEALPHLFEEFYRAPNARRFAVGTGIGLSVVKELVERYHGRIEVESAEGQGTTFTVTLPVLGAGSCRL